LQHASAEGPQIRRGQAPLVRLLIALVGAVAIGLSLGLLGSGGSILTVPVLHYLLDQPEQAAIGGSLLVVGLIAAAAAVPHARARQIAWRDVLWFGLPGMAGAWAGANLARFVPGVFQLAVFAGVMLVAAWRMLAAGVPAAGPEVAPSRRVTVVAGGAGVGLLSGVVGVGGGFLIVPALVLLARVPMARAVGTSLAIITLNSIAGFVTYHGVLQAKGVALDYPTLGLVTAVGVAGSMVGHRIGRRLPQAVLRRTFAIVLLAIAGAIVVDVARQLGG
jgi:uncharacterized membrane protein YfcA